MIDFAWFQIFGYILKFVRGPWSEAPAPEFFHFIFSVLLSRTTPKRFWSATLKIAWEIWFEWFGMIWLNEFLSQTTQCHAVPLTSRSFDIIKITAVIRSIPPRKNFIPPILNIHWRPSYHLEEIGKYFSSTNDFHISIKIIENLRKNITELMREISSEDSGGESTGHSSSEKNVTPSLALPTTSSSLITSAAPDNLPGPGTKHSAKGNINSDSSLVCTKF